MFNDILRTQLVLKKVIAEKDWMDIRDTLQYDFLADGHFAELKESEMMLERLRLADAMRDYVGKYYSVDFIRRQVLKQNDREMEDINKQIKREVEDGIISAPDTGAMKDTF